MICPECQDPMCLGGCVVSYEAGAEPQPPWKLEVDNSCMVCTQPSGKFMVFSKGATLSVGPAVNFLQNAPEVVVQRLRVFSETGRTGEEAKAKDIDPTNPPHYKSHPSGVECIDVTRHMNFSRGNAMKYLWRAGSKGGPMREIEDLKKAAWYLADEIKRLEGGR